MRRRATPRSRRSIAATSSRLALAWRYDTGEKGDTQTQPIVVGRTLYGYTPSHKTFALDAATGKQLWVFDSGIAGVGREPRPHVLARTAKDARVFAAVDNFVYALQRRHGKTHRRASATTAASICARNSAAIRPRNRCASPRPGVIYQRPHDRRRTGRREPAGFSRARARLRRENRRAALELSAPFRSPASPATTHGRKTPGNTSAAPTAGRA